MAAGLGDEIGLLGLGLCLSLYISLSIYVCSLHSYSPLFIASSSCDWKICGARGAPWHAKLQVRAHSESLSDLVSEQNNADTETCSETWKDQWPLQSLKHIRQTVAL